MCIRDRLDTATQTLTNKTLTSPVLTTPQINNPAATFQYLVKAGAISADRNLNIPVLADSDTFVMAKTSAIMKNKTLDSATVNNPILSGTAADVNGAGLIKFISTSSAVNDIKIANSATGSAPLLSTDGTDTNISLSVQTKGQGSIVVKKIAIEEATQTSAGDASDVKGYTIANSGTALAIGLNDGTETGEMRIFTNKGAGIATITPDNFAQGSTVALDQFDAATLIWDGTNWYVSGHYGATIA